MSRCALSSAALPRVKRDSATAVHLVFAGGGPQDGSLHGFYTLCGYLVLGNTNAPDNDWRETPADASCGNCTRIVSAPVPA